MNIRRKVQKLIVCSTRWRLSVKIMTPAFLLDCSHVLGKIILQTHLRHALQYFHINIFILKNLHLFNEHQSFLISLINNIYLQQTKTISLYVYKISNKLNLQIIIIIGYRN